MGHKSSPISMRLGITSDWKSRWFRLKNYSKFLQDDVRIRQFLEKRLKGMAVDKVEIERSPGKINIIIYTARPGLIIGRGGGGAEELKNEISRVIKEKVGLRIEIQEFRHPELSPRIMAEQMAEQIEKRIRFRRVLKQTLAKIMANKEVKGVKVEISGRLDGTEIARTEHLEEGKLPLQNLRADIDFAKATAFTTYGTVGVKVWIYKG